MIEIKIVERVEYVVVRVTERANGLQFLDDLDSFGTIEEARRYRDELVAAEGEPAP